MRILIHSYAYLPSIGGIERSTDLLAREWRRRGHEVRILTWTPAGDCCRTDMQVARQPNLRTQLSWARWADVVWQNHLSLRALGPALLARKPVWVTVQTWLGGQRDRTGAMVACKQLALRGLRVVAISEAIRAHIGRDVPLILNPVDPVFFAQQRNEVNSGELLFVGRLVPDKGAHLLLDAMAGLRSNNTGFRLVIAGDGPEASALDERIAREELPVERIGPIDSAEAARRMARCACLVVPSVWDEPLGIVALEGLAVGCPVVVSNSGGLGELTRFGALSFQSGDAVSLADRIVSATAVAQSRRLRETEPFALDQVADSYEKLMFSQSA